MATSRSAHSLHDRYVVRFRVLCAVLVFACSRAEAGDNATNPSAAKNAGDVSETDRKAEVTPEIAERAKKILEQHAGAPIGTEIPFTLGGKRYIARIEKHEDAEKGEHKGVTVYLPP